MIELQALAARDEPDGAGKRPGERAATTSRSRLGSLGALAGIAAVAVGVLARGLARRRSG